MDLHEHLYTRSPECAIRCEFEKWTTKFWQNFWFIFLIICIKLGE